MFSGELVDTRTPQQKQADVACLRNLTQLEMFSQCEIAPRGVRANPVMSLSPGRLVLVVEDPRSEEEIERDLQRQAERLTTPLPLIEPSSLVGVYDMPDSTSSSQTPAPPSDPPLLDPISDRTDLPTDNVFISDDGEQTDAEPDDPPLLPMSKYLAYMALVDAASERSATLSHSPTSAISESIQMSTAKVNARLAGLTGAEIAAALMIGEFRGRTPPAADPVPEASRLSPDSSPELPQKDWDVPVLWTNRADMMQRRPDLAPAIAALRDDEVEAFAALLAEALEEFYWIQLNVILSLFVDHELQLLKRVKRHT